MASPSSFSLFWKNKIKKEIYFEFKMYPEVDNPLVFLHLFQKKIIGDQKPTNADFWFHILVSRNKKYYLKWAPVTIFRGFGKLRPDRLCGKNQKTMIYDSHEMKFYFDTIKNSNNICGF